MTTHSQAQPPAGGWGADEFQAVFLEHYGAIYRHLFRLLGSQEEAEDLTQEAFLRLYRQRFPPWLTAWGVLDFHARLYRMPPEERKRRIPELLERVGLGDRANIRLGEFSKGMMQRIGLAQALLNRPDLVFLDEPTSGLDPLGRREVRDLIRELRAAGVTVFLNSHFLSEVEVTCDRIAQATFREAQRRRLLWIGAALGLAFLALFGVGYSIMYREALADGASFLTEMLSGLLIVGLYVVNFLGIMVAVVLSVDTLPGEIASGTIHTVVTKPLRRWEVVLGKWLGLAAMLALFVGLISTGVIAVSWAVARYVPPHPAEGIALMFLSGLVVLTLSLLGGARLSTMANGLVVLMLYGLAFIAGWIEQFGAYVRNEAAVNTGIVVSLLMPSEAMWKRAAYL
ncbi:MAG: ATP-binding cassette domain-containing protein, partial [Anaerolineae bacterium]